MASIYVFCERFELRDWIVELCAHEDLGVLCFGGTEGIATKVSPNDFLLADDIYQVFLFRNGTSIPPSITMNDVRQREWGWVNVRPGGLKKGSSGNVLLLSQMHGEKSTLPTGNPDKWVRWLKRKLKSEVHVGVVGKNTVYSGARNYDNIWYTRKATEMFENGIAWKQSVNDNSLFEPLSDERCK